MESYSQIKYGVSSEENSNPDFLTKFLRESPLNDSCCVVNEICHYLEGEIKELKQTEQEDQNKIDDILMNYDYEIPFDEKEYIASLFREYKQYKENIKEIKNGASREEKESLKTRFQIYCRQLRDKAKEHIGNTSKLANLIVYMMYELNTVEAKEFSWNIFGKYIFENVKSNTTEPITIPVRDDNGDIEYLGFKFSRKVVSE